MPKVYTRRVGQGNDHEVCRRVQNKDSTASILTGFALLHLKQQGKYEKEFQTLEVCDNGYQQYLMHAAGDMTCRFTYVLHTTFDNEERFIVNRQVNCVPVEPLRSDGESSITTTKQPMTGLFNGSKT